MDNLPVQTIWHSKVLVFFKYYFCISFLPTDAHIMAQTTILQIQTLISTISTNEY